MNTILIQNALIVNEGKQFKGSVKIVNERIVAIYEGEFAGELEIDTQLIEAEGKLLMAGVIDDQVHFREPGLTHKADIYTESCAAVAGGVTSFMDMPNVNPQSTTNELLEERFTIAENTSLANFSFYLGATNNNLEEILKVNPKKVCGIKVFMGSSTGNMLVDNETVLDKIFAQSPVLIATHCEDEAIIKQNTALARERYGENVPIEEHPNIRSTAACHKSSAFAVGLAKKHNSRLHILHVSSEKELELFSNEPLTSNKRITAEVCVHHLWFSAKDYSKLKNRIKWNPAIKTEQDRVGLLKGLIDNRLDVVATDHAPHLWSEKENPYFSCPSGAPFVQHSLVTMLELYHRGAITLEKVVEKMCHAPAVLFNVAERGFIREGYYADLVLVDLEKPWTVETSNILYKCAWSPVEGQCYQSQVSHTFVNGHLVYENGTFNVSKKGKRLVFNR